MRGGKGQGEKVKLTAAENKQPEINGRWSGPEGVTNNGINFHYRQLIDNALYRGAKPCK
jgi:hypothetical protein